MFGNNWTQVRKFIAEEKMDWKLLPSTQSSIDDKECSQKNRASLDKLFNNLEALLERDMSDCLSKQLHGLLNNNTKIYKARPSMQRREKLDYFEAVEDVVKNGNYKVVKESCFNQNSLNFPNSSVPKPSNLQTKSNRPQYSAVFSSKKTTALPQNSQTPSNRKNSDRTRQLKFERLPLTFEDNQCNALPSNGWWMIDEHSESNSDSETEAKVVRKTDCNSRLSIEIKSDSDEFDQSCSLDAHSKTDSVQSLFITDLLGYSNEGSISQTTTGSSPSALSSFFHLTSGSGNESQMMDETIVAPRPPQTSPDLDDKTCQTSSENDSRSCFSRRTSFSSEAATFDDDLKLHYKELFHYRFNTASRINYNNLEAFKHNYSRHDKSFMPSDADSSKRSFDKGRKITCVFPKVNVNKERTMNKKAIPAALQKKAVQRLQNSANIPVKLRLKHRSNAFTKFSEVTENNSTDERVLPTTLNKSADASYSVMTPYMANVVWSVMEDEKV